MLVLKLQVFQNDDEEMIKLVRISLMRGNSELMVRPCAASLLSVTILFLPLSITLISVAFLFSLAALPTQPTRECSFIPVGFVSNVWLTLLLPLVARSTCW